MKVGCQQCGASYSVADDKVAGRRLKLRCKKCGEPMVIDGSGNDPSISAPFDAHIQIVQARPSTVPALAASTEPDWYVAIDDNAQGPYTLLDVAEQYAGGHLGPDTLVFHDGLDGWKAAREVAELQRALADAGLTPDQRITPVGAQPPRARVTTPVAELLDRSVPMGSDPFAEPASSPSMSPRVSAGELMAGGPSRDGTVQFSLDAIRALSATAPNLGAAPPSRPGYASGEGSGLIDMRALTADAPEAGAFRAIADLQGSPLDTMAPLALPAAQRNPGIDFRTKVLAGLASFGFLLAGAVGIFAVTRQPPVQPQQLAAASAPHASAALTSPQASAAMAAEPKPAEAAQAQPEPPRPQAEAQPAAAEPEEKTEHASARSSRKRGTRSDSKRTDEPKPRAESKSAKGDSDFEDLLAGKAPQKTEKKEAAAAKGGSRDIDDLLDGAIDGKKAPEKREAPATADSSLPKTPSREQMLAALGKAKSKATKCKGSGVATAAITIAGSGKVSNVSVSGVEGAAKSCVEKAVRSTSFPKFQKDSFAVNFPFKLGA